MQLRFAKYPTSKFLLSRVESESIVIASIQAYIRAYLYENFDRVYNEFD
jgi:hypothetical protein